MSQNLSVKYYHEVKERLQKKIVKDIKIFVNRKNEKSDNMVVNVTKILQKIESLLSIEKSIIE